MAISQIRHWYVINTYTFYNVPNTFTVIKISTSTSRNRMPKNEFGVFVVHMRNNGLWAIINSGILTKLTYAITRVHTRTLVSPKKHGVEVAMLICCRRRPERILAYNCLSIRLNVIIIMLFCFFICPVTYVAVSHSVDCSKYLKKKNKKYRIDG